MQKNRKTNDLLTKCDLNKDFSTRFCKKALRNCDEISKKDEIFRKNVAKCRRVVTIFFR